MSAARRDREPGDVAAALYSAVHRGTEGDVAFHVAACAGAGRVLELGCGEGRIVRALAAAKHEVVGLDVDPALLALGRARARRLERGVRARIDLRAGDMRELGLSERFERVVLAHSTIYCLQSEDEVRSTLRGVREHLAPGGRLSIDAYAADPFHDALDPEESDPFEEVARVRVAGRTWRVLERSDWDRDAQRLVAHYRHEPVGGGEVVETTIAHRYLLAAQLERLLREEGLEPILVAGDFDGTAYDLEAASQLVVVAERA